MQTPSTSSPDPLLETQVFWERYKREILLALAAILVAIALFGAYRFYVARRDAAAAQLLANAKSPSDYQKIIGDYPQSGAAVSASLLLATQQRQQGQFAEANATLQKFIGANAKHPLVTSAKMAMAANLESMGQADEALEMYRRVAADYPTNFNAPLALLAQAQLLKQKGQIDEARHVCETVLTQYRDSYASMEASQYLKSLKSTSPPAPVSAASPAPSVAPAP